MVDNNSQLNALEPGELESFVESMEPSQIDIIGNQAWVDWHIRLQKLNQQAVLEASSMQEELTKETLISCGKLPVLVYESICIYVWRNKIFPRIIKLEPAPANTFGIYMVLAVFFVVATFLYVSPKNPIYFVVIPGEADTLFRKEPLYHEAAAVGLLETVLFHEDGATCISEVAIDLVQYALDQLTSLVALINNGYLRPTTTKEIECETIIEELDRQKRELQFDIAMRCISIVRYLAEHMEVTGIGACLATNFYKIYDVPSLMCHLIMQEPWKRTDEKADLQIFSFGRWSKPEPEELGQLHRSEAQLWLCLRQLLLEPRLPHYYTIDECRRSTFCRIQAKITEPMLDQIPPLGELKMFLCRLTVGDYSDLQTRTNGFKNPGCTLIEVVPQIKEAFMKQVHKRGKTIAKTQLQFFHMDGSDESRDLAKKLLDSYTSDAALALDSGGAKCAKCGEKAAKKCSRCKTEWYCGRECQVQQWPKHKDLCDQFAKLCL